MTTVLGRGGRKKSVLHPQSERRTRKGAASPQRNQGGLWRGLDGRRGGSSKQAGRGEKGINKTASRLAERRVRGSMRATTLKELFRGEPGGERIRGSMDPA